MFGHLNFGLWTESYQPILKLKFNDDTLYRSLHVYQASNLFYTGWKNRHSLHLTVEGKPSIGYPPIKLLFTLLLHPDISRSHIYAQLSDTTGDLPKFQPRTFTLARSSTDDEFNSGKLLTRLPPSCHTPVNTSTFLFLVLSHAPSLLVIPLRNV